MQCGQHYSTTMLIFCLAPFPPMFLTPSNVMSHLVVLSWQPSLQRHGVIRKYDVAMMKHGSQWMSANISDVINNTVVAIKVIIIYNIYVL